MAGEYATCGECDQPIVDPADAVIDGEVPREREAERGEVTYVHTWCRDQRNE